MGRAIYLLFVIANRLFWIAVCAAVLVTLFTTFYPYSTGLNRVFIHVFAIVLGFSILRLASARPGGGGQKGNGPAR